MTLQIKIKENENKESWIKWLTHYRYSKEDATTTELLIDFTESNSIEPFHIVSLACLIEEYHQNGIKIDFVTDANVDTYLRDIRFFEYWKDGFNRKRYTNPNLQTTLCLWNICQEMIDEYTTTAQSYYENNYLVGKSLVVLHTSLSEIFNNIFDHSGSDFTGYVITEYYPERNLLKIAVCDFGVGIPNRIHSIWEAKHKKRLSDNFAMQAAFRKGFSSRSTPRNRGFGLETLLTVVSSLKGNLEVFSNFAHAYLLPDSPLSLKIDNTPFFLKGTLISVTLDTRSLPDIEEMNTIDEYQF